MKVNNVEVKDYLLIVSIVATALWLNNQILWHKVLKKQIEEKDA